MATAIIAVSLCLYLRSVQRQLGPVLNGIKLSVLLDIQVVDDAIGEPISGVRIEQPFLHPPGQAGRTWPNST
ncbi:hypothetical protein [Singulisphaera sp. PoT]|uniref:hypothetical protein n=1 Tax=Singulisphaera sp. PoT TaxID=3411797 RepID=UPI003BF53BB0